MFSCCSKFVSETSVQNCTGLENNYGDHGTEVRLKFDG